MLLFWSMTTVIGIKVKGAILSYILFWIVFFIPAILHYDVPKRLLRKALPLLQQLDHSMKYERRSVIDRKELLVDVRLPKQEYEDEDEQDEEYLKSFNFDVKQRRVLENLEDEDEDEEIHGYVDHENLEVEYEEDQGDEEEVYEEELEEEVEEEIEEGESEETGHESLNNEYIYDGKSAKIRTIKTRHYQSTIYTQRPDFGVEEDDDDEEINSLLPDESLPHINFDSNDVSFKNEVNHVNMPSVDRAIRRKATKSRPSILDYYGDSDNLKSSSDISNKATNRVVLQSSVNRNVTNEIGSSQQFLSRKGQQNEQDIDETFDFLEEELNKY